MTVYESGMGLTPDLIPVGNGRMLAYLSGVSLWSLHSGYTAPSFLSLYPELDGGYYKSESEQIAESAAVRHRLWCRSAGACDLTVTDRMARGEGLLLRTVEGKLPLCWRLELPGYVRAAAVSDYHLCHRSADALFCDIPAGTPFDRRLVLFEEASLAIYLCGALHFEEEGRIIRFDGGVGHILFVDSSDRIASLQLADHLLAHLQSGGDPISLPPLTTERRLYTAHSADTVQDTALSEKLDEMARALLSMQSASGAVVTDIWHPYASAADLPVLTAAMLAIGHYADAKRMICRWAEQLGKNGEGIPPYLGCEGQNVRFGSDLDGASTVAFLLAALLLVESEEGTSDEEIVQTLYPKMRKAFILTAKCACDGTLRFSGTEECFEEKLLDRDCISHASASATAMAIEAAERYVAYCARSGHKIARESERYLDLLHASHEHFDSHFKGKTLYYLNAPEPAEKGHRSRFFIGICPGCAEKSAFESIEMLELDQSGRYRCKRCLSADREFKGRASNERFGGSSIESIDATANVALRMASPYRENALALAVELYRKAWESEIALPKRSACTDAMLVLAARRQNSPHEALFRQVLLDRDLTDPSLPRTMIDGDGMSGAMCASRAVAAMILALW